MGRHRHPAQGGTAGGGLLQPHAAGAHQQLFHPLQLVVLLIHHDLLAEDRLVAGDVRQKRVNFTRKGQRRLHGGQVAEQMDLLGGVHLDAGQQLYPVGVAGFLA